MVAADMAWMYRHPWDWDNFVSGVNSFLAQEYADMRTVVFKQCISPVYIVSARRSLDNGAIFFEGDCLNEGESQHHAQGLNEGAAWCYDEGETSAEWLNSLISHYYKVKQNV
jgi:uncharacterized protein (DUF427 family)